MSIGQIAQNIAGAIMFLAWILLLASPAVFIIRRCRYRPLTAFDAVLGFLLVGSLLVLFAPRL
ncbi:MAG: hypothetical protein OYH76_19140 [Defluviicoccus sp.]|nr:hypothetical protein [Defluviicoccus sp.]MDE0278016.1 hypothetical protein [Defluviicoccus sp.]